MKDLREMENQKILVIFVIFLAFSGFSRAQECFNEEVKCISCTKYQTCINGIPKVVTCDNGDWCNDPQFIQCQLMLNCYSYAINECLQVGIFPDKTTESKFYVCLDDSNGGLIKLDFSCLENEYFDEETLQCVPTTLTQSESPSMSVTEPLSTTPITSETSTLGETEPVTDPSSTALSTESSFPTTSPEFSPATLTSTELPFTTSTQMSDTTSVIPTFTTSTPKPPFSCAAPGIFADPLNCKGYFRCSTSLKKFYYVCPGVSYFNEYILKCSITLTPSCQKQILKNSTTPSLTTITTQTTHVAAVTSTTTKTTTKTPTTKSTPLRTVTTPITTTAGFTTLKPFSCQIPGIFSNPADCKTYFRCTASGNKFILTCPGDTYFNDITKTCSLNISPECKKILVN